MCWRAIKNMGATSIRLFELGRIFLPRDGAEKRALGLLFFGEVSSAAHWRGAAKRQLDFFDLKGAIDALRIPALSFRQSNLSGYALATEIFSGENSIGFAARLKSAPVFVAQIEFDSIATENDAGEKFQNIDKYPAVTRDIAMIVPEALSHGEIEQTIRSSKEPLLSGVRLFDLFSGKEAANIGAGRKSLAYTLTYRDQNRTLTNDEVNVVHTRIRERLQSELGAELRE